MKRIIPLAIALFAMFFNGINIASAQGPVSSIVEQMMAREENLLAVVGGRVTGIKDSCVVTLEGQRSYAMLPEELGKMMSAGFIAIGDSVTLAVSYGQIKGVISPLLIKQEYRVFFSKDPDISRVNASSPNGVLGMNPYTEIDFIVRAYGRQEQADFIGGYRGNGPYRWDIETVFAADLPAKLILTGKRLILPVTDVMGEITGLSAWPLPKELSK